MNIDPGSDVPLFVQIAEGIEEDIFTGSYAEGDRIPSTNELSALLGINPHTVLKGMNILVDEGIIYKRRSMRCSDATGRESRRCSASSRTAWFPRAAASSWTASPPPTTREPWPSCTA